MEPQEHSVAQAPVGKPRRARDGVFISYRCSDALELAQILHSELRGRRLNPFLDRQDLGSGKWRPDLWHNIENRKDFLVILTPGCLDRCADPDDIWQREVSYAIQLDRNVVPLLVDGFDLTSTPLPESLAALPDYQGVAVHRDDVIGAVNGLCEKHRLVSRPRRTPSLLWGATVAVLLTLLLVTLWSRQLGGEPDWQRMEQLRGRAIEALEAVEWQDELTPVLSEWEQSAFGVEDHVLRTSLRQRIDHMQQMTEVLARPAVRQNLTELGEEIAQARRREDEQKE